ncbi:UDP-glucuronosyltransferase 2a1-like [Plakobranchus ocellatus]|uniref:UDP-glucuronosyltransferase 2a1-like n=1 Tax=Plakobranchus ocellatus TaxID=259542 RepID=A0AAV4AIH0_9GAST|nr:UDP-glucuronosyltransferase 2a1-like [Plakobranchus ocellatus]
MTSGKQQVRNGRGRHKIGVNRRHLQRATSYSGWTKPPSNQFKTHKNAIENAIGPHVVLLTIVQQRKLKWYGHTTRSSGLAKTIMQDTVNEGRRGRQKKRWEDNIREWTGLELRNTLRKAEDREEWKAVVGRSSAAPRRIPNLRGR